MGPAVGRSRQAEERRSGGAGLWGVGLWGVWACGASCRRGRKGRAHHPRIVHGLEGAEHARRIEARRRLVEGPCAPQQCAQLTARQMLEEEVHVVGVLVGGVELDHVGVGAHAHQPPLLHDDIESAAPQHLALGDGLEREGLSRRRVLSELHVRPRAAAEGRHHAQRTERDHGTTLARYAALAAPLDADAQGAERLATGRVGVTAQVEHETAHRVDGNERLAVHAALAEQRRRAEGLAAAERARPRHDAAVLDDARLLGRRHRREVGGRVRLGHVSRRW